MANEKILSDKEKFCLDAYCINKNIDLAYILSRDKPPKTAKPDILHRMALRWFRDNPEVGKYVEERLRTLQADASNADEEDLAAYRDKDFLINQYVSLLKVTTEPKLRSEILWKISEMQTMRKQEVEDATKETRHYYLPLSCNNCSLYIKAKSEKENARESL